MRSGAGTIVVRIATVLLGAVLTGRAGPGAAASFQTPMSYLRTFGSRGDPATQLLWGLLIQAIVVIVIISLLILAGVFLRTSRWSQAEISREPLKRAGSGLSWISIGVGLSTLALIGSTIWTVTTMAAINSPPAKPALTIEVTGHQWWWEVRYVGDAPSRTFETANEIHIPVGEPVELKLIGADVIHSFWVPTLAGKTDLIPGQTNVTWIQAKNVGVYRGQCAEYCGQQHAHMAFRVFADPPEAFQAWADAQVRPAVLPASEAATAGRQRLIVNCGSCHRVRGTLAGGNLGPDLTHLMSRTTIAANTLPNTIGYLSGWIANPQGIKPGNKMPNLDLSGPELASIRSYLETLK